MGRFLGILGGLKTGCQGVPMGKTERREDLDHRANGQGCGRLCRHELEQQGLGFPVLVIPGLAWETCPAPHRLGLRTLQVEVHDAGPRKPVSIIRTVIITSFIHEFMRLPPLHLMRLGPLS